MLRSVPAPNEALYPADIAPLLDLFSECEACKALENRGLCHSEQCKRQVLPQLKQAAWQKDAHRGENSTEVETEETIMSRTIDELEKSERRQRQLDENAKRVNRVHAAMTGTFTRNRRKRAA